MTAGTQARIPPVMTVPAPYARTRIPALLDGIVGSLTGNHDIVHVAFSQASAADAYETGLLQKFGNRRAAAVSHAGFESADHLVNDHGKRATVWNASLDTLGNKLGEPIRFAI